MGFSPLGPVLLEDTFSCVDFFYLARWSIVPADIRDYFFDSLPLLSGRDSWQMLFVSRMKFQRDGFHPLRQSQNALLGSEQRHADFFLFGGREDLVDVSVVQFHKDQYRLYFHRLKRLTSRWRGTAGNVARRVRAAARRSLTSGVQPRTHSVLEITEPFGSFVLGVHAVCADVL